MRKLEKITLLFKIFFTFKNPVFYSNFKRRSDCKFKFYINLSERYMHKKNFKFLYLNKKMLWFLNGMNIKTVSFKSTIYFCIKLLNRILVISMYFKRKLLFSIVKSFKKKIRSFKKLEKIYKKKNLLFGVRRIRKKKMKIKRFKKKKRKKRARKGYLKYIFSLLFKFISFFKIANVNIHVFKSNLYLKKRGKKLLYQKKRQKSLKFKIFKRLKKVLNLKFYNNTKFKIFLSNNFSHSKKLLKLKKIRS